MHIICNYSPRSSKDLHRVRMHLPPLSAPSSRAASPDSEPSPGAKAVRIFSNNYRIHPGFEAADDADESVRNYSIVVRCQSLIKLSSVNRESCRTGSAGVLSRRYSLPIQLEAGRLGWCGEELFTAILRNVYLVNYMVARAKVGGAVTAARFFSITLCPSSARPQAVSSSRAIQYTRPIGPDLCRVYTGWGMRIGAERMGNMFVR